VYVCWVGAGKEKIKGGDAYRGNNQANDQWTRRQVCVRVYVCVRVDGGVSSHHTVVVKQKEKERIGQEARKKERQKRVYMCVREGIRKWIEGKYVCIIAGGEKKEKDRQRKRTSGHQ
jgi:hypothetical protein